MTDACLTFAIPFYSNRLYLERAITSVSRQSNPNWRLIVCDDSGAESGVEELVAACRDERMTYHRNDRNLGMVGNWNRCLDLAPTDLVTLLHADDELLECYAEVMLAAADRYPEAAACFCRAVVINEEGRRRFSFPDFCKRFLVPGEERTRTYRGEPALRALLRGNFIMCPTLCYRKRILASRRFASAWRFVQDLELTTRLLLEGETLVGLPRVAYAYRRHGGSATTRYTDSLVRFAEEVRLYDRLGAEARARGWCRAGRLASQKAIIHLNLAYCALSDACRLRLRRAGEKTAFLGRLIFGSSGEGVTA